jgi:alginate O-acetyltransferase complex protein AlgI
LPLLYFILQGIAVAWEEFLAMRGRPIDARPWFGRLWSIAWLVLPLPMLFHPPFLTGVILPLLGERPA